MNMSKYTYTFCTCNIINHDESNHNRVGPVGNEIHYPLHPLT